MLSNNIKLLCIFAVIFLFETLQVVNGIGVNYGILGTDLPYPTQTIATLKSKGVNKIRIYTPNQDILTALKGSNIEVFIGTLNEDLPQIAQDPSFATKWVQNNIVPYTNDVNISGITAGNELETDPLGAYVLRAMMNIDDALRAANITNVPVTTVVSYGVMGSSFPPSNGSINSKALEFMTGVTSFLNSKGYPLLANIYPYFAYVSNPNDIKADFALLKANNSNGFMDGGKLYTNLLVSMVDALYSALEKIEASNVTVIVSETGWPNAMGAFATIENAKEYNNNLVQMIESGGGTPRRPSTKLEAYIFAMYNENQKPAGIEQHWGLFYPNLQEVYSMDFMSSKSMLQVQSVDSPMNNFDVNNIDIDEDEDEDEDEEEYENDSNEETQDFETLINNGDY